MQNKVFSNNLKMFFYYIFILFITFLILAGINILNIKLDTDFNNIIIKAFFLIIYIWLFYSSGKIIGVRGKYQTDFSNFLLVFLLGLFIYLIAFLGGGLGDLENMNLITLPAYIFLSPFILISTIIGFKFSIFIYIILSIFISVLIGLSIRRKRVKLRNRRRKR